MHNRSSPKQNIVNKLSKVANWFNKPLASAASFDFLLKVHSFKALITLLKRILKKCIPLYFETHLVSQCCGIFNFLSLSSCDSKNKLFLSEEHD